LVLKLSFLSSIFFIASVSYSVAQIKNTALTKKDSTKNAFHSSQTPSSIHEVTEMEVGKYQQKSNAVAGLFPCKDCSGKYLEYDTGSKKMVNETRHMDFGDFERSTAELPNFE
jgi:hypothetical protein